MEFGSNSSKEAPQFSQELAAQLHLKIGSKRSYYDFSSSESYDDESDSELSEPGSNRQRLLDEDSQIQRDWESIRHLREENKELNTSLSLLREVLVKQTIR